MNEAQENTIEKKSLQELLNEIPEIYQPIFGHPELSTRFCRPCDDRLEMIKRVYHTLEQKLGRPLRVLDLGCAQGYFSLHLAQIGATTYGIDFQRVSINVCQALAAEFNLSDAHFQLGLVEKIIENLQPGQCDLVLGLSVFHHINNRFGIEATRKLLADLAGKTVAGIYEMALASEPMVWADQQPQDPRVLLQDYVFVHEIGRNSGYVAETSRPMYIASNYVWLLDNNIEKLESVRLRSFARANPALEKTRRFFFSDKNLAKVLVLDDTETSAINKEEFGNEVAFLINPPQKFAAPKLLLSGQHAHEAWLVRECIPEESLYERIAAGRPCNASVVLNDILRQLTILQENGLYHEDVRTWNVIVKADGHASLVDYGAITAHPTHREWPHNPFIAFMIFAHEVLEPNATCHFPLRASALNPDTFSEPYRSIFWSMLARPTAEWRFATLLDAMEEIGTAQPPLPPTGTMLALHAATEACVSYQHKIHEMARQAKQT
jgi:O-antigen chain-terminating methyltransferase